MGRDSKEESSRQTDRWPQGSGAASRGGLTSQLCHRPAGRAWERLPLLPCLSFPVCKVRSVINTCVYYTQRCGGSWNPADLAHLCFATGSLLGSARRGHARETHGQEEGDEMRPLQSASPQRAASVSSAQQRFFILHHMCLSAPVTKPSVQPLPTTAELGRGHAPHPPPLLQTV